MRGLPVRSVLLVFALAALAAAALLLAAERVRRQPAPGAPTPRGPVAPRGAPLQPPAPGASGQPRPAGDGPAAAPAPDYGPLVERVRAFLAGEAAVYGVYFQDLFSGAVWGIEADRPFPAASTYKVPLVLFLYEEAAAGRISLDERLVYDPDTDYRTGAGILHLEGVPGRSYSLRVLANLSITISDNVAAAMLLRRLGRDRLAAFKSRLGGRIVFPEGRNVSTAADMGRYVKEVLAFARRHELGRVLLDHMSNSIYDVGLPGLLPAGVRVAHKEGDVSGVSDDVGVVYGRHPFILCVLSEGQADVEEGFRTIARLTRLVYDYQESVAHRD